MRMQNDGRPVTLAVAESCTGGLFGARITETSGASKYFLGGVIAYQNHAKTSLLGVPKSVLGKYGAVSAQTAVRMASGVRKKFKADIGIAVTGIAGPGGGRPAKPVGLVYIALSTGKRTVSKKFFFKGSRVAVRRAAAAKALAWFYRTR